VNVVDLGLIYDCQIEPLGARDRYKVGLKMTLTAPGCGMGPVLSQDVQNKLLSIEEVEEANVELVWDPQWNQDMMTEAAKLQLGLM
jgi:metal-sulfur cluster biosynthetic enzyme